MARQTLMAHPLSGVWGVFGKLMREWQASGGDVSQAKTRVWATGKLSLIREFDFGEAALMAENWPLAPPLHLVLRLWHPIGDFAWLRYGAIRQTL